MKLNEFTANPGATKVAYRKGRGAGSGNGKTAGRGHKGQKARSGGGVRPGFEGGQIPYFRRVPKRGFNNKRFAKRYVTLPLDRLNVFADGDTVDMQALKEKGVVAFAHTVDGIKLLAAREEFNKKLTVKVAKVTSGAKEQIEQAGGTVEEV
ncbi:MAG TPA: 50S ribosomal protein L15 [Clostridiaceae bacterium]|nr:50S ribosomal protein L15 [Clostridiaceae bacterium]